LARVGQTLVAGTSHGDDTSRRHKRVRKSRLACSSPGVSTVIRTALQNTRRKAPQVKDSAGPFCHSNCC
jgi:hypothetical protein